MENKQKKPLYIVFVSVVIALLLAAISLGIAGIVLGKKNKTAPSSIRWYTGVETPQTQGENGDFYIDTDDYLLYQKINGSWSIIMENFGKGENGQDGVGILSIEKTSTNGLVDTYTITLTNGNTSTFTVTNGSNGANGENGSDGVGILSIAKTSTNGLVDTYTITFTNGTTTTFEITNGSDGADGENGSDGVGIVSVEKTATNGLVDTYTITFTNGTTTTFEITNGSNGAAATISINADGYWVINGEVTNVKAQGENGSDGVGIVSIEKTGTNDLVDTYTITFTNGSTTTFEITNGSDGEQGLPGENGAAATISINDDGYWVINGEVTDVKAQGENGADGVGIVSIEKTDTDFNVDTYTITFTDGNTTTFTVTNADNVEQFSVHQEINYDESIAKISNPDQGFFKQLFFRLYSDGGRGDSLDQYVVDGTQQYRLVVDISEFSSNASWSLPVSTGSGTTSELTDSALNALRQELDYFKRNDKTVVVRFTYKAWQQQDFDREEPEFDMLLKHVEQIAPILDEYASTVTALEGGFIGDYGEMTDKSDYLDATYYNRLIDTFLDNNQKVKILLRQPKMFYDYCGITTAQVEANAKITLTERQKRIGLFNDALFGSATDYGTYEGDWTARCKEISFLSQFTNAPYGGESLLGETGAPFFLSKLPTILPEGYLLSLSYLNEDYHPDIINQWKNLIYDESAYNSAKDNINDKYSMSGLELKETIHYIMVNQLILILKTI